MAVQLRTQTEGFVKNAASLHYGFCRRTINDHNKPIFIDELHNNPLLF